MAKLVIPGVTQTAEKTGCAGLGCASQMGQLRGRVAQQLALACQHDVGNLSLCIRQRAIDMANA